MSLNYNGYGDVELLSEDRLFVHVCPECKEWQVEYTEQVFLSVAMFKADDGGLRADLALCHDMVNEVVEEHYREKHRLAYQRFLKQKS